MVLVKHPWRSMRECDMVADCDVPTCTYILLYIAQVLIIVVVSVFFSLSPGCLVAHNTASI